MNLRGFLVAAFLMTVFAPQKAGAGDSFNLDGDARLSYWTEDRALAGDRHVPVASLWVKGDLSFEDNWGVRIEGWIKDQPLFEGTAKADLRKAYLRWRGNEWDVRIGRQIEVWGRSDILAPTDNLGAWNYTALFAEDNDQRLGSFMIRATYGIADYRLEALWLPEFRPSIYPLPSSLMKVFAPETGNRWRNGQFAAKFDQSGRAVDWSVSWFHGLDRTFSLSPATASPSSPAFAALYPQIDVVGADAATSLEGIGLRAEIAYTHIANKAPSYVARRSQMQFQLGAEIRPFSGTTVSLYYLGRYVTDYRDPRTLPQPIGQLAIGLSALWFQQDRVQNGGAIRLATAALNDTLIGEVTNVAFMPTGEGTTRLKATYLITDTLKVIGGFNWFWGPNTSYFGSIRKTSGAFIEMRYAL